MSYEQTLRLFTKYLKEEKDIQTLKKLQKKIIRKYINYTKNRGKYTIVGDKKTLKTNTPEMRKDYGKKFL